MFTRKIKETQSVKRKTPKFWEAKLDRKERENKKEADTKKQGNLKKSK